MRLKGQYIIQDSTLTGNTANFAGAAILALGESNGAIINSTVSDNTSNSGLATIQAQSDSNLSMQISNSTIADNTAPGVGFFGYNGGTGAVTITNSLFADNNGNTVTNDPAVVISGGHNLSDDGSLEFNGTGDITNMAATLGPLQNNGGATPTHLPLPGSPAINAGEPGFTGLNRDQRGATRVRGGRLDIGAVEIQGDLPVFTSSPTASIPENSSATIQSVNANGPGTSYSITGNGDDDSLFQIVNGNQLRFTAGRDFENPTDANGDNVYEVEIMASSSVGLAVTQTVSVTVTPLNDNSPIFTSSDNNVIPENTTAVQTLTASDADLPGQTVSFAITGGPDSSQFQIVNGNQLQFVNAPDFENPADSNANNIYAVQLTANDGNGLTTDQSFSVRVADVVEDSLLCDFDADADCDGADINALQANLANGPADPSTFDLTGDGQVTLADRDEWLALAGAENLTSGNPYRVGDANLDGSVDISDFNLWNANKFTSNSDWTSADFSADGSVDISDFNLWNSNKFQSSDSAIRGLSNRHDRNQRDHSNESDINLVDRLFAVWMVPSNL